MDTVRQIREEPACYWNRRSDHRCDFWISRAGLVDLGRLNGSMPHRNTSAMSGKRNSCACRLIIRADRRRRQRAGAVRRGRR